MGMDDAKKIAGRYYQPGKRHDSDEVDQGLKETHEQVANFYMEGTVDEFVLKEKNRTDDKESQS